MKAIHNIEGLSYPVVATVFNISKIQNESNSQPGDGDGGSVPYCVQYFKDTK